MDTKKYLFSNKDLINLILPLTVDQYLGKNNEEMACKAANELLSFTLKAFLGVTILAYLGRNLMIRTVFGNIEQDVMYNCKVYMLIVFASIPMIALYNAGTSLFWGVPGGLENSMFQLGKILVLGVVSGFGTASIAANAVANTVATVANIPGNTIGLAVIPVIGRCLGAGDKEQAKRYAKQLLAMAAIGLAVMNIAVYVSIPFVSEAYHLTKAAKEMCIEVIRLFCIFSIFFWALSFTLPQVLRSGGDAKYTMSISILSMWIFRVVLSYYFVQQMDMGLTGVWLGMCIDWICRSIFFGVRFLGGKWMEHRVI